MHASCAKHRLQQGRSNGQCCQQFLAWISFPLWGPFSVKSQTIYKCAQCFSGLLRSLFILLGKDPQTNWHVEHLITHAHRESDETELLGYHKRPQMMWCHILQQCSKRPALFCSHTRRPMPLNAPHRELPKVEEGEGSGGAGGSHADPVLYTLGRKGRGLVEVSPQQQRTAYGKCPSYPS